MEALHWKEVAIGLLAVLNTVAAFTLRSVFQQLSHLREAIFAFERHAAETFARRDHLEQQLAQLIQMVNRLDDKVSNLTTRRNQ